MIDLDGLEEILREQNYPALYELEEGELAVDAFKKMISTGKLVMFAEDLPKVMKILEDPIFMALNTQQKIYDELIKKTFGIPKIKNK